MINIVCTSKPNDGLLYYSYEYATELQGNLIIVTHPGYTESDYLEAINKKYIHCNNVYINECESDGITLVMGRSMITLPYLKIKEYSQEQILLLHDLFSEAIVVYSENHPVDYPKAIEYFHSTTYDLCDYDVYPNGVGDHFEKRINFGIYKPIEDMIQYDKLLMGTNKRYYEAAKKYADDDSAILVYTDQDIEDQYNHVFCPVDNLIGKFNKYVYTKDYFDPAPRLIQEFRYFGKEVIYARDRSINDGGSVYWERELKPLDVEPILRIYNDII